MYAQAPKTPVNQHLQKAKELVGSASYPSSKSAHMDLAPLRTSSKSMVFVILGVFNMKTDV